MSEVATIKGESEISRENEREREIAIDKCGEMRIFRHLYICREISIGSDISSCKEGD